jgi:hypothetical protein
MAELDAYWGALLKLPEFLMPPCIMMPANFR